MYQEGDNWSILKERTAKLLKDIRLHIAYMISHRGALQGIVHESEEHLFVSGEF